MDAIEGFSGLLKIRAPFQIEPICLHHSREIIRYPLPLQCRVLCSSSQRLHQDENERLLAEPVMVVISPICQDGLDMVREGDRSSARCACQEWHPYLRTGFSVDVRCPTRWRTPICMGKGFQSAEWLGRALFGH